jgi:serine phosphatase RsbU (regulator of sigma subunit)
MSMVRSIFLFACLLIFANQTSAQNTDSLQIMNGRLDDGYTFLSENQFEKASRIGLQVLQFGRKTNNPQLYAQSCLLLTELSLRSGNWNEGVKFASRGMESVKEVDEYLWCSIGVVMVDLYLSYGVPERAIGLSQRIYDKKKLTKSQEFRLLNLWVRSLHALNQNKESEELLNRFFESRQADFYKNPNPYLDLFELWVDAMSLNFKSKNAYLQTINLLSLIERTASKEKLFELNNKAGELCINLKDYNKAISFFNEALALNDNQWKHQENYVMLNLARAYYLSGNYDRSFDIAEQLFTVADKNNFVFQKAITAAFIARLRVAGNAVSSAVEWANVAYRLSEEMDDKLLQHQVALLLSELFELNNEFDRSRKFKRKADQLQERMLLDDQNNKLRLANLNIDIANIEFEAIMELQNFEKQRLLLNEKLKKIQFETERQEEKYLYDLRIANEGIEKERAFNRIQKLEAEKQNEVQRYQISELENKRKSNLLSISELKNQKQDIENKNLNLKLRNDKLAAQDELNKKEIEFRKKQSLLGILFTAVVLLILLIIVFFYRKTRSQNKIIEKNSQEIQLINRELGEKNNEIISGIQYASKFQEMVYPKEADLSVFFEDGFVIHRPLEMVSGDLPFIFKIQNHVFVAAVDCIGHGVSASMLSIMTYFGLTDIIRNNPEENCSEILRLLHRRLVMSLSQFETRSYIVSVDLSLMKYDLSSKKLQFSGANLPMIILSNGQVQMYKGAHISIGENVREDRLNFVNHDVQCQIGDELYLFSDGLFHQFGGEEGKQKLSKKRIIKMLAEIQATSFNDRKLQMNRFFDDWKGECPQTDDLVILGVKV